MTAIFAKIAALFVSPLIKWAIGAAAILAVIGGIYMKGNHDGAARVQAKWDRAVQVTVERGEKARADAERDVERDPDGLRDDPLNRDKR